MVSGLEYYVCDSCGEVVMSLDMADKQAKNLAQQYKAAHQIPSGEEIKQLRLSLGLSQKDFEKYLGVSSPSVSRWETEAVIPSLPIAFLLTQLMSSEQNQDRQFKITGIHKQKRRSGKSHFKVTLDNNSARGLPGRRQKPTIAQFAMSQNHDSQITEFASAKKTAHQGYKNRSNVLIFSGTQLKEG